MVVWGVWNPVEKVGTSGVGKARVLQEHETRGICRERGERTSGFTGKYSSSCQRTVNKGAGSAPHCCTLGASTCRDSYV